MRIPHFPLAVALRDHPDARDQPVALIGETAQVARVEATSRQAAERGVTVGMTASRARARCPDLRCLPWEPARHADAADELVLSLEQTSPRVVPADEPGTFWLDARGMRYLGGEPGLIARVRTCVTDLGFPWLRLGLADTAGVARAMALHPAPPEPPIVPPGGDAAFLGELPLRALDLDEDLRGALRQLGISSIATLRDLPAGSLETRFGAAGRAALDLAFARDPRRPSGTSPVPLPAATWILEHPVDQSEPLLFGLRHLLRTLAGRLQTLNLSATRLCLVFTLDDHGIRREVIEPTRPLHHESGLFELLRDRLERLTFDAPVVELQVQILRAQPATPQQVHLDAARFDPAALEGALNRLQGRYGEAVVMVPQPHDDHRPEAAGRWLPVTRAPVEPSPPGQPVQTEPTAAVHRRIDPPTPIDVRVDEAGRPVALCLEGRWRPAHAHGPERLSGHWLEAPFGREDWRVAVDTQVWWISRDETAWLLLGWWD